MLTLPPRRLPPALLALALALSGGCGAPPAALRPDPAAVAVASASARLVGSFHLVQFTPAVPLEPMLQQMLLALYPSLVVRFDGQRFKADAPGLHLDRAYQIRDAGGDRFTMVSFDEQGVPYTSRCDFGPSGQVLVYSESDPWRGVGTLQRFGP